MVAAPVSAGTQQSEHVGHLVPAEWQRQELQGYAKFHQVLNSALWGARQVCMLTYHATVAPGTVSVLYTCAPSSSMAVDVY